MLIMISSVDRQYFQCVSSIRRTNQPLERGAGSQGAGSEDEEPGAGSQGAGVRMMTSLPVGVGSLPVMTFVTCRDRSLLLGIVH